MTPPPRWTFALRDVVQSRGGNEVLHGVSADIPAGHVTALVGPSGAGKTSLLRLLNRLDDPVSGTITFDDRPITSYPVRSLRCRVGFVFQSATMFPGSVADNLRAAAQLAGESRGTQELSGDWERDLLRQVELDESYAGREAESLSGGEKQRVAIARALATSPEVLLLDEPTSALDPEVALRLMATVSRVARERGHTMVMVTHRLAEARDFSSYLVMMENGRVVEQGTTRELFAGAREARTRAYLGSA